MKFFALLSAGSMIYFLVHILDCYVCAETGQFGLHRQPRSMSRQAQFVEHSNHFLDVPKIEGIALPSDTDCLLRCMRNDHCFSLNVAAFSLPNGSTSCDLLSTDKYNASDKFKEDRTSHHFSIMNPCENFPCQHGRTCHANYETYDYSCACKQNYTGNNCEIPIGRDCFYLLNASHNRSGVYYVDPDGRGHFSAYCDMHTDGGGWTVFQRRQDGSVDFYRNWDDYKVGFGQLTGEFWLGNDKIHRLTAALPTSLRVDLEDWNGDKAYAKYGKFDIGDEQLHYQLDGGSYSGTAGNSLAYHYNMSFSTKDSDNDDYSHNCAVLCTGAWWYKACLYSNLNGKYLGNKNDSSGILWFHFRGELSLKFTELKLRPAL